MELGKLDDGRLKRPPRNGRLADGTPVSGYATLIAGDAELAAAEGWLPVVDDGAPEHDEETHRARRVGWEKTDGELRAVWELVELPPDPRAGDHLDPQIGAPDD